MNGKGLMKQHSLEKKTFHSNPNMEDITDTYYMHVK